MDLKTVLLVQVVTLVSWLPCTFSYCTWAGANPYWTGTPTVEQVSGHSHGAPHCQWSVSLGTSWPQLTRLDTAYDMDTVCSPRRINRREKLTLAQN